MELVERIKAFIIQLEDRDFYKYAAAFITLILLLLSLLAFIHYRKVTKYHTALKKVDTLRTQTKKLLHDYQIVKTQRQKVEDILEENTDFRVGEAYQAIIQKLGLLNRWDGQTVPSTGETVSGKVEVFVNSHLTGITMKQLTDLLSEIATVPQLYTKELTIKKSPTTSLVDVDITIATLENSSIE